MYKACPERRPSFAEVAALNDFDIPPALQTKSKAAKMAAPTEGELKVQQEVGGAVEPLETCSPGGMEVELPGLETLMDMADDLVAPRDWSDVPPPPVSSLVSFPLPGEPENTDDFASWTLVRSKGKRKAEPVPETDSPPPSPGSKVKSIWPHGGLEASGLDPGPSVIDSPTAVSPTPESASALPPGPEEARLSLECVACHKEVSGEKLVSCRGRHWHRKCIKCSYCRRAVVGRNVMLLGESLFCATHKASELRIHTKEEVSAAYEARVLID